MVELNEELMADFNRFFSEEGADNLRLAAAKAQDPGGYLHQLQEEFKVHSAAPAIRELGSNIFGQPQTAAEHYEGLAASAAFILGAFLAVSNAANMFNLQVMQAYSIMKIDFTDATQASERRAAAYQWGMDGFERLGQPYRQLLADWMPMLCGSEAVESYLISGFGFSLAQFEVIQKDLLEKYDAQLGKMIEDQAHFTWDLAFEKELSDVDISNDGDS